MRQYKQWSPQFRQKSLNLTNKAKTRGWIAEPEECRRCGQTEGIIHLHNEDYDVTVDTLTEVFARIPKPRITEQEKLNLAEVLEPLCWRCHMIHHSEHRNKEACDQYWEEIKSGKKYPPVYKHSFWVLKNDHNI